MKNKLKKLMILGTVILGVLALWYIIETLTWKSVIAAFESVTPGLLVLYVLIQVIMLLVLTIRWHVVLKSQGFRDVNLFHLMNYKIIGYSISFLTPSAKVGGEPVRAGLLAQREGMEFKKALSSVVIDKTLELSTSGLFFVLGAIIILLGFVVAEELKFTLILLIVVFLALIIIFNYRMMKGKEFFHKLLVLLGFTKIKRLRKFMRDLKNFERLIIKFYSKDTKHFFMSLAISFISWLLMFFEFKIAGAMVGVDFTPVQIFLVFSVIGGMYLVPIPMALGALEAGEAGLFKILKISTAAGVALALLVRLKDIIITVYGLIALTIYGLRFKDVVKEAKSLPDQAEKVLPKQRNKKK